MASITSNIFRIGNFTSSPIHRLVDIDSTLKVSRDKAENYIKEKNFERKLGRSISNAIDTRPMLWGKFLEPRIHKLLPNSYVHVNDETIMHPYIDFWAGSPDSLVPIQKVVADMKCPQPPAFCELIENLTACVETGTLDLFKKNHANYFWQLVSNAIITGSKYIELIVYMPYESELPAIKQEAYDYDGDEPWKYRFIYESSNEQLAYLPDGSYYKNLNIFRFELDPKDALFLTKCVLRAGQKLNNRTIKPINTIHLS